MRRKCTSATTPLSMPPAAGITRDTMKGEQHRGGDGGSRSFLPGGGKYEEFLTREVDLTAGRDAALPDGGGFLRLKLAIHTMETLDKEESCPAARLGEAMTPLEGRSYRSVLMWSRGLVMDYVFAFCGVLDSFDPGICHRKLCAVRRSHVVEAYPRRRLSSRSGDRRPGFDHGGHRGLGHCPAGRNGRARSSR